MRLRIRCLFLSLCVLLAASIVASQPVSDQVWQSATISSGAITITCYELILPHKKGSLLTENNPTVTCGEMCQSLSSSHAVKVALTAEGGGPADSLTAINGCTLDGARVALSPVTGDTITIEDTPGVIELPDDVDVVLDSIHEFCTLQRKGGVWVLDSCSVSGSGVSSSAVSLTLADTTPQVSPTQRFYDCDDTTVYTDFVDSDGDYSEFTFDFFFVLNAIDACGIDCSSPNISCNGGVSWTASIQDTAICSFSVSAAGWTCVLSDPDAINTMSQESSTIVAPATSTTEWMRMSGDATASAWGSDGAVMNLDIDNDQAADCTFSKSGGIVTFDCNNTNAIIQPGQSNGDIKFYDSAGTECLELDPDTGVFTQGTNCATLAFGDDVDILGTLTGLVRHSDNLATAVALSGADCRGGYHKNTDADPIDFTLCDGVAGGGQLVCFEDRAGGLITVDVADTGETITLADGTALDPGDSIDLAAGIGNGFCIFSDSATAWHVLPGAVGVISDGGPE